LNSASLLSPSCSDAYWHAMFPISPPQPQTESPERELIRRVCEGDQEAFCELVRPHERSVYFAAKAVLDNEADVEEVAQEAILKALTRIRDFRAKSKFSTWLIQITINERA
jgi:RNA polymerase sigma-70 factor (ECF subfamily)